MRSAHPSGSVQNGEAAARPGNVGEDDVKRYEVAVGAYHVGLGGLFRLAQGICMEEPAA